MMFLTIFGNVLADFSHRVANVRVRVEQMMVLLGFPFSESGKLLRDRLEQSDNHPDGC